MIEGSSTDKKKHDVAMHWSIQEDWDKIVEGAAELGKGSARSLTTVDYCIIRLFPSFGWTTVDYGINWLTDYWKFA